MAGAAFLDSGLCAQTDPEAFHPDKGGSAEPAKAFCRRCPAQADCLDYALAHDERFGVWGGTSPRERDRIRRQHARPTRTQQGRADKRAAARRMHAAGRGNSEIARELHLSGSTLNAYLAD